MKAQVSNKRGAFLRLNQFITQHVELVELSNQESIKVAGGENTKPTNIFFTLSILFTVLNGPFLVGVYIEHKRHKSAISNLDGFCSDKGSPYVEDLKKAAENKELVEAYAKKTLEYKSFKAKIEAFNFEKSIAQPKKIKSSFKDHSAFLSPQSSSERSYNQCSKSMDLEGGSTNTNQPPLTYIQKNIYTDASKLLAKEIKQNPTLPDVQKVVEEFKKVSEFTENVLKYENLFCTAKKIGQRKKVFEVLSGGVFIVKCGFFLKYLLSSNAELTTTGNNAS